MNESGVNKAGQNLDVSHSPIRRRLLQSALQQRPNGEISTAAPTVQFREPEESRSLQNLTGDIRTSGLGSDYPALVRIVEILSAELQARREEIRELHIMLRQTIDSNIRRPWWAQAITHWPIEDQQQQG